LIPNTIRYLAEYGDSLTNSVVSLGPVSNNSRAFASLQAQPCGMLQYLNYKSCPKNWDWQNIFGVCALVCVTNVKCKLVYVILFILILVFTGFVCWNSYNKVSFTSSLRNKRSLTVATQRFFCQFPILSKCLTPTLTRSVCLNWKLCLCIILL